MKAWVYRGRNEFHLGFWWETNKGFNGLSLLKKRHQIQEPRVPIFLLRTEKASLFSPVHQASVSVPVNLEDHTRTRTRQRFHNSLSTQSLKQQNSKKVDALILFAYGEGLCHTVTPVVKWSTSGGSSIFVSSEKERFSLVLYILRWGLLGMINERIRFHVACRQVAPWAWVLSTWESQLTVAETWMNEWVIGRQTFMQVWLLAWSLVSITAVGFSVNSRHWKWQMHRRCLNWEKFLGPAVVWRVPRPRGLRQVFLVFRIINRKVFQVGNEF